MQPNDENIEPKIPQYKDNWDHDATAISKVGLRTTNFPYQALADTRLSRRMLRVLMAFGTYSNRTRGDAYPSQEGIGKILGLGRRHVGQAIKDLETLGYIIRVGIQNRKIKFQLLNPDLPSAPTEGAGRSAPNGGGIKKFRGEGQDHAPNGGGTNSNLTVKKPLTPLELPIRREVKGTADGWPSPNVEGLTAEHGLSACAVAPSGASRRLQGGQI